MNSVSSALFTVGTLLGVAAMFSLLPLMRRFTSEGRKAGFDFYSWRATEWFFRPERLPTAMQPVARKIRERVIFLLWPAAALVGAAWLVRP